MQKISIIVVAVVTATYLLTLVKGKPSILAHRQSFALCGFEPHFLHTKKPPTEAESFKKGGGGIRTHGTFDRTTVFKTAPINRSGTPPWLLQMPYIYFYHNHTQK